MAMVQTLGKDSRLERFAPDEFDLIWVDETHRIAAAGYQNIVEHFRAGKPGGPMLVGTTATDFRSNVADLSKWFGECVYRLPLLDAMDRGLLAPLRVFKVRTREDLAGVKSRGGDFVQSELGRAVDTPERNALVAKAYREITPDRKGLIFTASLPHNANILEAMRAAGFARVAVLDGNTDPFDRKAMLRDFADGTLQTIINCEVLTEGFDEPSIETIHMPRPTESPLLLTQCVGRGTRKHPGKADCIVVEYADRGVEDAVSLAALARLPSSLDLDGADLASTSKRIRQITERAGVQPDLIAQARTLDEIEKIVLVYEEQRLRRQEQRDRVSGMLDATIPAAIRKAGGKLPWIEVRPDVFSLRFGAVRSRLSLDPLGKADVNVWRGDPGSAANVLELRSADMKTAIAEIEKLTRSAVPKILVNPAAPWRGESATEKQRKMLKWLGVSAPLGLSRGDASRLIDVAMARRDEAKKEGVAK